ncbi:hypothetical protein W909_04320 [Dickeya zeae EC1]|nr:hypothetical protein W909_04320 [Dickeya zeae EC1]
MYAITLGYSSPKDELEQHIDAHKKWLADNINLGNIIFAAPRGNWLGGFILAYGMDSSAVNVALSYPCRLRTSFPSFSRCSRV